MKKVLLLVLVILLVAIFFNGCSILQPTNINFNLKALQASERVVGQDYYALQSRYFNVKESSTYLTPGTPIGSLDNTFDYHVGNIQELLLKVNPVYYRVHLINATCIRNNNCGNYEIGHDYTKTTFNTALEHKNPKIIKYLKDRTLVYKTLSLQFPETKFIISPALEHDLSIKAFRVAADAVLSVWSDVQLANSPDGGVAIERYKGAWIERHGDKPQSDADIASLDGAEASQIDIDSYLKRTRNTKITYVWQGSYNCRIFTWEDPRKRTHCPLASTFELLAHIADVRADAVAFTGSQCSATSTFKSPDIWKPEGSYAPGDLRSFLPVTISKFPHKKNLNILDSKGDKVGTLGYYGTYLDQGYRWYSGFGSGSHVGGYEFEKRAVQLTGNPWVWLQADNACKGPLLTGKRFGKFH